MKWGYSINNNDLFDTYGVAVESGTEDFLKMPTRKASVSNDWQEENGIEVDLSAPTFESRDITLSCWLRAAHMVDFWRKYNSFWVEISQPGTFILFNTTLQQAFNVFYKQPGSISFMLNNEGNSDVFAKFQVVLTEPDPMTGFMVSPTSGYVVQIVNGAEVPVLTNSGRFITI